MKNSQQDNTQGNFKKLRENHKTKENIENAG